MVSVILLTSHLVRHIIYLDPGSGSFLLQVLLATLLGAAVILRTQWSKIKGLFGKKTEPMDDEDDDADKE